MQPDPRVFEAVTPEGLVRGHGKDLYIHGLKFRKLILRLHADVAYSITDTKLVDIQTPRVTGKIPLVRVRNPWGNETEWKGAWSDA